MVTEIGNAQTSFVQRKLKISYSLSSEIINALEANGVESKRDSHGRREVLTTQASKKDIIIHAPTKKEPNELVDKKNRRMQRKI